jgi:hypothetical protein
MYWMSNKNPSRKIFVTYEERVRHLNQLKRDETATKMAGIDPNAKVPLGCERTVAPDYPEDNERYDEWVYTKIAACFADQCPSSAPNKPVHERDPRATCERLCAANDPSCLKYSIPNSDPLAGVLGRFNDDMINANPPTPVRLSALVNLSNAYTGTDECYRTDLTLGRGTPISISNSGSSCPIGVALPNPNVSALELTLPGDLTGSMTHIPAIAFSVDTTDDTHSPTMYLTEQVQQVYEPVFRVTGTPTRIAFWGKKYYCAQLDWQH